MTTVPDWESGSLCAESGSKNMSVGLVCEEIMMIRGFDSNCKENVILLYMFL